LEPAASTDEEHALWETPVQSTNDCTNDGGRVDY
jgi:hypothetical protein